MNPENREPKSVDTTKGERSNLRTEFTLDELRAMFPPDIVFFLTSKDRPLKDRIKTFAQDVIKRPKKK